MTAAPRLPTPAHTLQRKNCLAHGRPMDHAGRVSATCDPAFDLQRTIFATVRSPISRVFQRTKLDARLSWDEAAAAAIEAAYAKIERLPLKDDAPLFAFMHTECDFSCEHADGSFLDHLLFCREYTARHYAAAPPRAMLLHSILGVGTNLFPMPAEKLPTLERLVDAEDMVHISAFPSILRLLIHGYLLPELLNGGARGLTGLSCHRLIDNKRIHLGAEQLWVHLNLQLIHAIDFLPPAAWAHSNEYFFQASSSNTDRVPLSEHSDACIHRCRCSSACTPSSHPTISCAHRSSSIPRGRRPPMPSVGRPRGATTSSTRFRRGLCSRSRRVRSPGSQRRSATRSSTRCSTRTAPSDVATSAYSHQTRGAHSGAADRPRAPPALRPYCGRPAPPAPSLWPTPAPLVPHLPLPTSPPSPASRIRPTVQ